MQPQENFVQIVFSITWAIDNTPRESMQDKSKEKISIQFIAIADIAVIHERKLATQTTLLLFEWLHNM